MKRIDLKNGYCIERPDERNYVLNAWREVNTKILDKDGKPVKILNDDGKLVCKTVKEFKWMLCGYYGRLEQLIAGMVEHKCHTSDVDSLKALYDSVMDSVNSIDVNDIKSELVD